MSTQKKGSIGESVACRFLASKGYEILERNYRKPWGEIDIIAIKAGVLRFVEVKSVSRESSVDISREVNDYKTAAFYVEGTQWEQMDYQIDVVAVYLNLRERTAQCRLTENVL